MTVIDLSVKKHCIDMYNSGCTYKTIYQNYFSKQDPNMNYNSFCSSMRRWRKLTWADNDTLYAGTYPNFTAHNATVQVDKNGNITQAWIKQRINNNQFEELVEEIKKSTSPIIIEHDIKNDASSMLEIPLYDMHFPFSDYKEVCQDIINIISSKHWEEINLIIGQDCFHNDDFEGRTASGNSIEKVDVVLAWRMAKEFWDSIITHSITNSNKTKIYYSKGNHDKSMAWAFVQMLKSEFPDIYVDDSLDTRKCIYWNECFIGITHGNNKNSKPVDLRGQFTIQFPNEFAQAKVREIHAGHLHHEKESDLYGVMIRRLSSGVPTDKWSDDEGFIGSNKRFMLFAWEPGKLRSIYYI